MHRSGTSAVTPTVHWLGVPTCVAADLVPGSRGNPGGHWESRTVIRINDGLLRSAGGTWWCPPAVVEGRWASRAAPATARSARAAFYVTHPTRQWVTKDPRLALTFPFWRTILRRDLVVLLVLRDPLEIAGSLQRRNGFPLRLGLALWERYMHHAIPALAGLPVLVVRYEEFLRDTPSWSEEASAFLSRHGIDVEQPETSPAFVEPELRHEVRARGDLALEPAASDAQRELASLLEHIGSMDRFESTPLPQESASTAAMFSRLRRRFGLSRAWRWRRALLRDRSHLRVRECDLGRPRTPRT